MNEVREMWFSLRLF